MLIDLTKIPPHTPFFHYFGGDFAPFAFMEKREYHWEVVTSDGLGLFAIGMGLFLALLFNSTPGFVFMVDHANVIFREVGHSIVGFVNPQFECFGGAIAQLALPVIMVLSFRRNGSPLGFATSTIWLSENLLNIAHVVSDPGAKSPPLIGGADHDWIAVLDRLGILQYEPRIVFALTTGAWIGMGLACLFVLWRASQGHRRSIPMGRLVNAGR
jgi:hypothetical protein